MQMTKRDLKKLGINIRNLRKSQNLSQEAFAEQISKCRNYVGLMERGEVNITVDTLFDISKKLKFDIKKLFDFE